MDFKHIFLVLSISSYSSGFSISQKFPTYIPPEDNNDTENAISRPEDAFKGVYSECVVYLSYSCIQKKTLKYLERLNEEPELNILGDYVKFVKREPESKNEVLDEQQKTHYTNVLISKRIDEKIEEFFDSHVLRLNFGNDSIEDVNIGTMLDVVEGRKKGSGGGGGGGDSMKKKMMMMAMMCMKMKMMVMMPAMMGMMGMMSFKGMMLGGLSLLISKILLILKLMGGMGGGKGGSGGGSPHGGGDMQSWMPAAQGSGGWNAGGDSGGGGGGGYNANGEWQSRSGWEILRSPHHHQGRQLIVGTISATRKKRDLLADDKKIIDELNYVESDPEALRKSDESTDDDDEIHDPLLDDDETNDKLEDIHDDEVEIDLEDFHHDEDDDEVEENDKPKKKRKIFKNKKKNKKQPQAEEDEEEETLSSYFSSLKDAVEDNMWD